MSPLRPRVRFATSRVGRSVVAAIFLGAFRLAGAQATSQTLIGDVIGKDGAVPLGHAMVTVLGIERQTFTSERGTFAFPSMDPGKYRIRVVRIGYTPVEVNVTVRADSRAAAKLRIELARLSVQLSTMRILAKGQCTMPGRPNPDVDPDFAAIVAQVRMNAEQYQLLSDSFPFRYKVEQVFHSLRSDSTDADPHFATEYYRSDVHGWEYKAGDVIERAAGRTLMHLPTLPDFASYDFLNNHCFRYAGLDSTRDGVMIRIGFDADVQIRTPDVSGSVLLDAKTYQIKRTELDLTKIPSDLPQVTAVHVTTIFGELSPSIDVIEQVHGITSACAIMGGERRIANALRISGAMRSEWIGSNPAKPTIQP